VSLTSPIRNPDVRDPAVMSRRAWWLIVLSVLMPGSAQLLAGNRRLGRVLFGTWLVLVAVAITTLVSFLVASGVTLSFWVSFWGLLGVQVLLVVFAILSFIAAVDTFRLVRFVHVPGRTRVWVAALTVIAMCVPAGAAAYGSFLAGVTRSTIGGIFAERPPVEPIDGKYTFMLLGGDAGAGRIGLRPDSASLVTVDATSGQIAVVGIPRNLYNAPFVDGSPMRAEWPDGFNCGDECLFSYIYPWAEKNAELYPDAAAANSTPGIEATRDSIEAITGITVQFYILIDMKGFSRLIDALGGVDILIEEVVHVCVVGEPVTYTFNPGETHLSGKSALMYARTRCDSNDFDRMARQRQIQEAILRQVNASTVLSKFNDLAAAGKLLIKTDMPQSMVGVMVDLGTKARKLPMRHAELVPPEFDYLYPNFRVARAIVREAVFPPRATPSPTPNP
jgi:LCP family protein required for cell wall assembly